MVSPIIANREGANLLRDFGKTISPAWTSLVGLAADQLDAFRAERRLRLASSLHEKMKELGIESPTRDIAPTFLIPLLEHASLEKDDNLQDVWATMLANAADKESHVERRAAFVAMLAEMTYFDVSLLSLLSAFSESHPDVRTLGTINLPGKVEIATSPSGQDDNMREDVLISLANLNRLGCLQPLIVASGGTSFAGVNLTHLGRAFVRACTIRARG